MTYIYFLQRVRRIYIYIYITRIAVAGAIKTFHAKCAFNPDLIFGPGECEKR